jgi:hypothetical protein
VAEDHNEALAAVVVSRSGLKYRSVWKVLSAILPGVGQLYNGRILAGILWLIITPGLWIGTGALLGWVCHVIAAYTAYSYARDHRVRISAPWVFPERQGGKFSEVRKLG